MIKQLFVAYTGEEATDELFLGAIIRRMLDDIAQRHGRPFVLYSLTWLGSSKGNGTLEKVKEANKGGNMMLYIHRDTDQHDRAYTLINHFHPIVDKMDDKILEEMIIVPLIIKHEQETWFLADLDALNTILGTNLTRNMLHLPKNLEDRANTKEIFAGIIREANVKFTRDHGFKGTQVVNDLAKAINLSVLTKLDSYQKLVGDTEAALRKFGYIN